MRYFYLGGIAPPYPHQVMKSPNRSALIMRRSRVFAIYRGRRSAPLEQ